MIAGAAPGSPSIGVWPWPQEELVGRALSDQPRQAAPPRTHRRRLGAQGRLAPYSI